MLTVTREVHSFSPDLGPLEHRLLKLGHELTGTASDAEFVERSAAAAFRDVVNGDQRGVRKVRWAFALSLLADILAAGGTVRRVDSSLRAAWPDWDTPEGEAGLRTALLRLRRETHLHAIRPDVLSVLPSCRKPSEVVRLVQEGEFELMDAAAVHPSGVPYGEVFSAARRSWTMPLRDREGRNHRFVLTVSHRSLGAPLPVGILEVGDGSPLSTARDEALGLTPGSLMRWLRASPDPTERLRVLEGRLSALLLAVLPIPSANVADHNRLYARAQELEELATGRSVTAHDFREKKRLSYVVRLTRGREAMRACLAGGTPLPADTYAAVRGLRDLTIPRINLELTVCGALPPFATALVGKLMVAFAADRRIRGICRRVPGTILGTVFDLERLQEQVPKCGAVLLTTKGLFPRHSAQYSRAELPGRPLALPVPLRKIGDTSGITASLMSKRTYRLARQLLEQASTGRSISGVFGSGGSKRQRRIEAAVQELGLPEAIIHPRIRRPIYAAALVSNLREICLLNERPKWSIPTCRPKEYAMHATGLWRERWLSTAERRLTACQDDWLEGVQDQLAQEQS